MNCIYTAKYLVSGSAPPIEDGALHVHAGRIAAIGTRKELLNDQPSVKVVDFSDALIVPLLVNAHTHLELTDYPYWESNVMEEESPPKSFVDWILRLIRIKKNLDVEQYRLSLLNGIAQSIAAGTGAVGDILSQQELRNLYQNCPLSGSLFLETLGQDPALVHRLKDGITEALQDETTGLLNLGISPHSPYTLSKDYLQDIYSYCQKQNIRCTTHIAESPDEIEFLEQSQGDLVNRLYPYIGWEKYVPQPSRMRPVEYLQQQGGLFPGNLLVHGVQLSAAEIEILVATKMSLALCPRSNASLDVGKAPAGQLHRAGVKLALGTDSLASCDSLSIWDEMAFAHRWFEGELDAPTLFNMATQGGAEALGIEKDLGSLQVGKIAGFQILRPKTTVAVNQIFDYFVSSTCTDDIVQVYHHGQSQFHS